MDAGTISAAFLQGRITALTYQLRERMKNLAGLLKAPEPRNYTITYTATEQLRMDVESTALVRAAEEVMVLTRELKDLWLFGGLGTVRQEGKGDEVMEGDARVVYDFVSRMVDGVGEKGGGMEVDTETA